MGPLSRIIVRYGAGALCAVGLLAPELSETLASDEDVIQAVAFGLSAFGAILAEGYYWLAKNRGWVT